MLFNLPDGKPSFLPRPRARSVPRRHSSTTKFHPLPHLLKPIPFACPFTSLPTRQLFPSRPLAPSILFPAPFPLGGVFHFFSRVMRFRVFAFIRIPPNALPRKCLVASNAITSGVYRGITRVRDSTISSTISSFPKDPAGAGKFFPLVVRHAERLYLYR